MRCLMRVAGAACYLALSMLLLVLLAAISGCWQDRVIVKPQIVEVPVYVREPIPEQLTTPIVVAWPDAACWRDTKREWCNGQLDYMARIAYPQALEQCNADRAALSAEQ